MMKTRTPPQLDRTEAAVNMARSVIGAKRRVFKWRDAAADEFLTADDSRWAEIVFRLDKAERKFLDCIEQFRSLKWLAENPPVEGYVPPSQWCWPRFTAEEFRNG